MEEYCYLIKSSCTKQCLHLRKVKRSGKYQDAKRVASGLEHTLEFPEKEYVKRKRSRGMC